MRRFGSDRSPFDRFSPDPFIVALLAAAIVASFFPARGWLIDALDVVTPIAIGLLFFLYGARLSTQETWAGIRNWRLQLVVLLTTFAVFPLFGLALQVLEPEILTPALAAGVLLLCLAPSTVQSSVVNTRIAGGNVAASVVSASLSNLIGVFATPALVAWLMTADAQVDASSVLRIVAQLLAPFVVGQLVRPWIGPWVERRDPQLKIFDRSTIVLVVFVAFSKGAAAGIWSVVGAVDVLVVFAVSAVLLAVAMAWCVAVGRIGGFSRADRWTILFCGSNKSLASGLPIASVLFPGSTVALIVLPLMIYHQLQIMVGSVIAARAGRNRSD